MRIGLLSTPLLFQHGLALQQQIHDMTRALNGLQCCQGTTLRVARLDPDPAQLAQCDLIHVFGASGAGLRMIEAAVARCMPVVLSPLIAPGWDRLAGEQARQADAARSGAAALPSSYAQTRRALQLATLVVSVGAQEKRAIEEGFLIDAAKVRILSNGVSRQLFEADGDLFRLRTGMRAAFVLMAGPISPYHHQLALACALAGAGLPLVLLGEARERDQGYLRQVRSVQGVTCLGGLDEDPRLLASAFAAASVLVLSGMGDAGVRSMFEALATGTPVVVSSAGAPALADAAHALRHVPHNDAAEQQRAVMELVLQAPARASVRALARPFTWERTAQQLAVWYAALAPANAAVSA